MDITTTTADGTTLRANTTYAHAEWAIFENAGDWRTDRRLGYVSFISSRDIYTASSSTNGYAPLDRSFGSFDAALAEIIRLWDLTPVVERATMGS